MSLFSRKSEIVELQQKNELLSSLLAKKDCEMEQMRSQLGFLKEEQLRAASLVVQLNSCKEELDTKTQMIEQYVERCSTAEKHVKILEESLGSVQHERDNLQKQVERLIAAVHRREASDVIHLPSCDADDVYQFEMELTSHLESLPYKTAHTICAYLNSYSVDRLHKETHLAAERRQWNAELEKLYIFLGNRQRSEMQKLCMLLRNRLSNVAATEKQLLLFELCGADISSIRERIYHINIHTVA